jgi:hypothetical protein|nr:MAG TPA_asm: hypothetical protein [Caudoviricetes sp.]
MGKEIHLSATAAVRRILKGDTLSLSLQTNGVPLFQGLNPDTFTVSPNWSESGTHPIITPSVGSARKNNVTLTNHAWAYNGKDLGFRSSGAGWETSTVDNRFKLNHTDGSLSIVADLASKVNQDSDTLTYSGDAVLGASIYPMQKSIDILVSMLGGSSYFGGVSADTTVLSKGQTEAILRPWLFNSAGGEVSTYSINLYRGSGTDLAGTYDNPASGIIIHRDKTGDTDKLYVDSHQLFVLEFIVDGAAVYRTGISIDDISDIYQLALNSVGQVDEDSNQTFRCIVTNCETGLVPKSITGNVTFAIYTDSNGNIENKRSETMNWAKNVSDGFVVRDADTIDENKNIIGVSVSADAYLTVDD